jgi:hypothetical protein
MRIEHELVDARRDLEEKESALDELREVVQHLRLQIAARGPSEGPEAIDNVLLFDDAFH